jgi:flagellar protein FlaJ
VKEKNPVMMLYPLSSARKIPPKYLFIGQKLSKIVFTLKYDLDNSEINIDPARYSLASLISAFIYFFLFTFVGGAFAFVLFDDLTPDLIVLAFGAGILGFFVMFFFHLFYPRKRAKEIAKEVEEELLFALRTLLIQVSSGISLFEAMRLVSRSNYGQVSEEFHGVIRDVNSGMSESKALEKLAFKTKSDIFKKIIWQMLTTMKSGGSVVSSLRASVEELVLKQMDIIKGYAAELNMWTLIYLIVAAALPSLGVTFLVIASAIGTSGIGVEAVILIAVLAIGIQLALIFLLRTHVPKVIK